MSDAVRRLIDEAEKCRKLLAQLSGPPNHNNVVSSAALWASCVSSEVFIRHAIAAVEAELNAVPAVTSKPGFDNRSTDYPDYVENYR